MKKIKLFIQQLLFTFSLEVSKKCNFLYSIVDGKKYSFFYDFGPKILIIRNHTVHMRGTAFSIHAVFDDEGKLLYCKPICLTIQKGDIVFYGEYNEKYQSPKGKIISIF